MSRESRVGSTRSLLGETSLPLDRAALVSGCTALLVAVSTLSVVTLAILRLVLNAPVTVGVLDLGMLYEPTVTTALGMTGIATVAVSVAHRRVSAPGTIGLLAVGIFGVLAVANDGAVVPAVGAIAAGGALALEPWNRSGRYRSAVVLGLTVGVAGTLLTSARIVSNTLQPLVVGVFLLSLAATAFIADTDVLSRVVGAVVVAGTLIAGAVAPFVTGAVTLAVGGAAAPPLWLLALGAGGVATTLVALARAREYYSVAGGVLVVAAGVPGTLQRAVAVVVGAVLLLRAVAPRKPEVTDDG